MPNRLGRVCFVCHSLRAGGTEKVIALLANHLVEKYQVTVVTLSEGMPFYRLDPKVCFLPLRKAALSIPKLVAKVRSLLHVRAVVKMVEPSYICVFGESINSAVLVSLMGLAGKKIVFDRASPLAFRSWRRRAVNPYLYRLADTVVVQTERARELAKERYKGVPVEVLSNPVNPVIEVRPIRARSWTVVNVGFLGGQKNQELLIRCFLALEGAGEWTLELVGDGPDRERLQTLVAEQGADDRVRFLGEIKDVEEVLSNAQVFAFVSKSEGFPNALSEALFAGCACISFDCVAGPSELIAHESNGLLVPTDNEEEYADQLGRLLKDAKLRQQLSKNAVQSMVRYRVEEIVKSFEKICTKE